MALDLTKTFKIAWVNFKELIALAKESAVALYGAVMTVFAGIFLIGGILGFVLLYQFMREKEKSEKVWEAQHLKDIEIAHKWTDSLLICQYKLNNCLEQGRPIIIRDTVYLNISKKR